MVCFSIKCGVQHCQLNNYQLSEKFVYILTVINYKTYNLLIIKAFILTVQFPVVCLCVG